MTTRVNEEDRESILRSDRSAVELARFYGVSDRTVFRLWKDAGRPGQKSRAEIKAILGDKPRKPLTRAA